jgi:hypothetical protein
MIVFTLLLLLAVAGSSEFICEGPEPSRPQGIVDSCESELSDAIGKYLKLVLAQTKYTRCSIEALDNTEVYVAISDHMSHTDDATREIINENMKWLRATLKNKVTEEKEEV